MKRHITTKTMMEWHRYTICNSHFTILDLPGVLLCPWACLIMAIGISALILGLWPMHLIWTYYCIIRYSTCSAIPFLATSFNYQPKVLTFCFLHFLGGRTKLVGPVVKLLLLIAATAVLITWLVIGIPGSLLAGLVYGFLAPIMATFDAVGEGKEKPFVHCFVVSFFFVWVVCAYFWGISFRHCLACYSELQDGTWSTITGSCTVVRDVKDLLFHSYFSIMDDLRLQKPPDGEPYEIRSASCWLFAVYIFHLYTSRP